MAAEPVPFAVEVPGGVLAGVRAGRGDPLLVLHGGPGLSDYTGQFAAELAGWDALRYTQRGVAPSVPAGPFTIDQHLSDALAVLDQHELSTAVVLGHSWGGYLAMQLAAAAPERVRGLVLLDTLGGTGDGGFAEFGRCLTARLPAAALARTTALDELATVPGSQQAAAARLESLRLSWPGYFADPSAAPAAPDDLRLNPACYAGTYESIAAAQAEPNLGARLARYRGPVELVGGQASPFPASVTEATAALFSSARITMLTGTGHFVWAESPGCVAAALRRLAGRLSA